MFVITRRAQGGRVYFTRGHQRDGHDFCWSRQLTDRAVLLFKDRTGATSAWLDNSGAEVVELTATEVHAVQLARVERLRLRLHDRERRRGIDLRRRLSLLSLEVRIVHRMVPALELAPV